MTILGINFGHDASAVLMKGSQVLGAIEEEKMSRKKQDFGWPALATAVLLEQNGLSANEVDVVAFGGYNFNELGLNEIRYRFSKDAWHRILEVSSRILAYYGLSSRKVSAANRAVFEQYVRKLGFSKAHTAFFNHHFCHAYSAFCAAPFRADLVITADGQGDQESFNFYKNAAGERLEAISVNSFKYSIGQFYSTVTGLLGFRPNRHEGKITGLAAYGKPTKLVERFRQLFFQDEQDNFRRLPDEQLEAWWEQYGLGQRLSWRTKVNFNSESAHGEHYARNSHALLAWMEQETSGFSKEDIAYACQAVTEEVMVEEARRILNRYFPNEKVKIALAGGVFANVRVNQKIAEMPEVTDVFVQPAMGDAGLSLGAAYLADLEQNPVADPARYVFSDTYLGPDFGTEIADWLRHLPVGFKAQKMESPARDIAQLLFENKIVGFWQGRMEWGPRALGSRSIILNTFDRTVNDSLNQRLNRTEFMPFAPSVIDRAAKKYFPKYDAQHPAADYMTITYDVDPMYHELLQAVTHVDGTARPQIVRRATNPYYYDILDAFERLSGCGAIVNTSFNAHEEPIVSTPQVAFKALQQNRIDFLVLEEYLISPTSP
jgi:carbamoyltransferase